ncbi:MAG TPA: hypothetical protein VFW35_09870 [Sphingomicrobium sp.]|nr:hypothetical protein [Sphingomicrobium sp.]
MNSVLGSILQSRIFYNWRMAKRGWPYLLACLVAAGAAGTFAGFARNSGHPAPFGLTRAEGLAGFVSLAVISGLLWWRFSSFQDEMFHRIQNYSYGWGASVTVAVLVVWGIANAATLAPPIDPIAPLVIFALTKSFFWSITLRKWL